MAYDPDLTDVERLRKKIKRDPKYQAIANVFQTDERFQIPVEGYVTEVRTMFKMRKFRSLDVNSPTFMRRFAEAIIQDQSYRSRMTEMLTQCFAAKRSLDRMLDIFGDYVLVEYSPELKMMSTAKERDAFIKGMTRRFEKYSAAIDGFLQEVEYYVKDIDKAGYSAKNIAEVYAIVFKKEGNIPSGSI